VYRRGPEIVGAQDDDVGLFARGERTGACAEAECVGTVNRRPPYDVSYGDTVTSYSVVCWVNCW